jgi:hypothetical protein
MIDMRSVFKSCSRQLAKWKLKRIVRNYERRNPYLGDGRPPLKIAVESEFDRLVVDFGGAKISSLLSDKSNLPRNADYFFQEDNVIAELKILEEGDSPFGTWERFSSLIRASGVSGESLVRSLIRESRLPREVLEVMQKRFRRTLEERIKFARLQLQESKRLVGDSRTRTLVLLANERFWFASHAWVFGQICKLMSENFDDERIDGIVYFSAGVVSRLSAGTREYSVWSPAYRKQGDVLGDFVNRLGERWLKRCSELAGEPGLEILQVEDSEIGAEILRGCQFKR